MSYTLRDGSSVEDRRLDWIYPGVAAHMPSLAYLARDVIEFEKPLRSYTWTLRPPVLDQGSEGSCVGHGIAHELLASPDQIPGLDTNFAKEKIYWQAQKRDWWPGGAYPGASPFMEGTSVLHGAQVVTEELGYYKEYRWALDLKDMAYSVAYKGPMVIGVAWHEGMFNTDEEGFIHPSGAAMGGHCVVVLGIRTRKIDKDQGYFWGNIDLHESSFLIQNSWGSSWGQRGRARITLSEFVKLINGGEFMVPIRRRPPYLRASLS